MLATVNVDSTTASSPVVMGYENWQGNKYEWMQDIIFCKDKVDYTWEITQPYPNREIVRIVQGEKKQGEVYITRVVHGRYMDIIVSNSSNASSSTRYCDSVNMSAGVSKRAVARAGHYSYAYGGVAFAYAYYDSSGAVATFGSRLAFHGKVVITEDVTAFKTMENIK